MAPTVHIKLIGWYYTTKIHILHTGKIGHSMVFNRRGTLVGVIYFYHLKDRFHKNAIN